VGIQCGCGEDNGSLELGECWSIFTARATCSNAIGRTNCALVCGLIIGQRSPKKMLAKGRRPSHCAARHANFKMMVV